MFLSHISLNSSLSFLCIYSLLISSGMFLKLNFQFGTLWIIYLHNLSLFIYSTIPFCMFHFTVFYPCCIF